MRKKLKQTLSCMLWLLMTLFPITIPAQFVITTNIDNTITITGNSGVSGSLNIPDTINNLPVVTIGYGAFQNSWGLTAITNGKNIKSIEDFAFSGSGLTNVYMSGNVSTLGYSAFRACTSLNSVAMPNSVATIGDAAFYGCQSLYSVIVSNLTPAIGQWAFLGCGNLTNYIIPSNVKSIGLQAFDSCVSLSSVTIPDHVTSIGNDAFNGCSSLTNVTTYDSILSIGSDGFYNCTALATFSIPKSLTSIGEQAFYNCTKLQGVVIPGGVGIIQDKSFFGCSSLTKVEMLRGTDSIGNYCFANCSGLTNVTIPNSVTNIGNYAFYNCPKLSNIKILSSVASIGSYAFGSPVLSPYAKAFYFSGNPPAADWTVFTTMFATIYYLPGTIWDSTFNGISTVMWNPTIMATNTSFGMRTNQFGFMITGNAGIAITIEACTNLTSPVWTPVQTLTLNNGSFYFSDLQSANYPSRFYGIGFPQ